MGDLLSTGKPSLAIPDSPSSTVSSSKTFRVGVLSPLMPHNPRSGFNFGNMPMLWQLFEPAYRSLVPSGHVEPVLLEYPLRPETSYNGMPVFSAAVRAGKRFWDGTVVTGQHIAASLEKTASFSV